MFFSRSLCYWSSMQKDHRVYLICLHFIEKTQLCIIDHGAHREWTIFFIPFHDVSNKILKRGFFFGGGEPLLLRRELCVKTETKIHLNIGTNPHFYKSASDDFTVRFFLNLWVFFPTAFKLNFFEV